LEKPDKSIDGEERDVFRAQELPWRHAGKGLEIVRSLLSDAQFLKGKPVDRLVELGETRGLAWFVAG
jgi:hypothetical protein